MKTKLFVLLLSMIALASLSASAQAASGFTKINTSLVTATTYTDSSGACLNQTSCYFQVTAVDAQGFESQPSPCSTTQLCVGGTMAFVMMPSSGTHTVTLSWTASTTPGISGYNVYRHVGPLPAGALAAVVN